MNCRKLYHDLFLLVLHFIILRQYTKNDGISQDKNEKFNIVCPIVFLCALVMCDHKVK